MMSTCSQSASDATSPTAAARFPKPADRSEGARERGSEGARERGSEGATRNIESTPRLILLVNSSLPRRWRRMQSHGQDDQSAGTRQGYYEAFPYTNQGIGGRLPAISTQLACHDRWDDWAERR